MGDDAVETLTVRHTERGHSFEVESATALPPSARPTGERATYELDDGVDCPICNPPDRLPGY